MTFIKGGKAWEYGYNATRRLYTICINGVNYAHRSNTGLLNMLVEKKVIR